MQRQWQRQQRQPPETVTYGCLQDEDAKAFVRGLGVDDWMNEQWLARTEHVLCYTKIINKTLIGYALLHKVDEDPLVTSINSANARYPGACQMPQVIYDDPYSLDTVHIINENLSRDKGHESSLLRHIGKERQVSGETGADWTYSMFTNACYDIGSDHRGRSMEWQLAARPVVCAEEEEEKGQDAEVKEEAEEKVEEKVEEKKDDDEPIAACLRDFCHKHNIPTEHVLVLNAERRFGNVFASVVYDWDNSTFLPNFPDEVEHYRELRASAHVTVTYKASIQLPEPPTTTATFPCCANMTVQRLGYSAASDYNAHFAAFLTKTGNYPHVVFEVKTKTSKDGPNVATKYYKLLDNQIQEVEGNFTHKIHAYKSYVCHEHNLCYEVDLITKAHVFDVHAKRMSSPFARQLFQYTKHKHLLPELLSPAPAPTPPPPSAPRDNAEGNLERDTDYDYGYDYDDFGDYDDYDYDRRPYYGGYDSDCSFKSYSACDKDCGYCGNC